jgi:peroxiredoxin
MKKIALFLTAIVAIGAMAFTLKSDNKGISIGDKAPMSDAKMKDISGKSLSLQDLKGENGLLVVFSCNTCPFVLAWEDRYNDLYDVARKNKVGMVLVNSNEAKRSGDDSMTAMQEHAKKNGYKMSYVEDREHKLADAFGARTTPHVYIFNKNSELVYMGAIDDNSKDKSAVKDPYVKNALVELGKGQTTCKVSETKAIGCSIKRMM